MKTILLVTVLCVFAASAQAMNRYNTRNMTCSQVQAALKRDGAAQLQYAAPDNPSIPLYDTFVSATRYCRSSDMSRPAYVTARDTKKCKVRQCVAKSHR